MKLFKSIIPPKDKPEFGIDAEYVNDIDWISTSGLNSPTKAPDELIILCLLAPSPSSITNDVITVITSPGTTDTDKFVLTTSIPIDVLDAAVQVCADDVIMTLPDIVSIPVSTPFLYILFFTLNLA